MKSEKDNIKDIFSSKLRNFEPELPPSMWEKISSDLPAQPKPSAPPIKRSSTIYKLAAWTASAAAVILAVFLLMPEDKNRNTLATNGPDKNNTTFNPDNNPKDSAAQMETTDPEVVMIEKQSNIQPTPLLANRSNNAPSKTEADIAPTAATANIEESVEDTTTVLPADITPSEHYQDHLIAQEQNKQEELPEIDREFEKDLENKIAAFASEGENLEKLFAENTTTAPKENSSNTESKGLSVGIEGGGSFSKATDIQNQLRIASLNYYDGNSEQTSGIFKQQKMKLHHNQPVSFGLVVNKRLSNRISLETGITYTYLYSKIKSIEGVDYSLKDSQYFHYLGIPLTVNYKLAEWQKIRFYLSGGAVIQKDIYGRMKSSQDIADLINMEEYSSRNISQKHPQFSTTASLGISYPLYQKLSIYTNLGTAYYFNAKNEYETIYSDRRWIFNLNFGLKLGF